MVTVISGALTSTKEPATENRIPQAQVSAHADLMRVVLGGICVMLCMARGGGPSCLAGSSRGSVHVSVSFDARALRTQSSCKEIDDSHFCVHVCKTNRNLFPVR